MKICQDMDGVIFNIMTEFIRIYNEIYDDDKTFEDVNKYEFYSDWNLSLNETFGIFNIIDQRNTKLLDQNIPECLEIMNALHDVDIVTLKPKGKRWTIIQALEQNGIYQGIHYNELVIKPYNITDIKARLDYDVYIDDNAKLAEAVKKDTEKVILIYDSPWNRHVKMCDNCYRVHDWNEILEVLEGL